MSPAMSFPLIRGTQSLPLRSHASKAVRGFTWTARKYNAQKSTLPDIDAKLLKVSRIETPKKVPASSTLVFGHTFTDHMLTIPWSAKAGWASPEIVPYGPLTLDPSCTVFHYAQTVFEGLKAYRSKSGRVTLFRPDMNMARMNNSAARIALPAFDGDALLELIKKLVHLDAHWIPQEEGHSLYLRPTLIGTQRAIGVGPPDEALLFVICSPVGPYYANGFKPVSLLGTTEYTRAAHGGTGAYKLGANYAPGVVPQKAAAAKGYDQNLWLMGPEHYLTEVGTMNIFVALKNENGATELITPPLEDIILPGVTRDSVLKLAEGHASGSAKIDGLPSDLVVSVRPITMGEVKDAASSGRLLEIFGAGTAAIISPVKNVGYMGKDIAVPTGEDGLGPITEALLREIVARQTGAVKSDWSFLVSE